jgi:hypothetical protein
VSFLPEAAFGDCDTNEHDQRTYREIPAHRLRKDHEAEQNSDDRQ